MKNFICGQYGKTRYFKQRKYQNLWMNNKARCNKNAFFAFSYISAEYLQKI